MKPVRSSADELPLVAGGTSPAPWIAETLRMGQCPPDRAFDSLLPEDLKSASSDYWTPLAVALKAARWLDELEVQRVLDIGAGPGKFCVAVALASRCELVGLEHRPRLVGVARALAHQFGVKDRARFLLGSLQAGPLPAAGAYYLYNPFGENLFGPGGFLAHDVELSCDRYALDIGRVQQAFRQAPEGTVVITYNGFGGSMPASYEPLRVDRELPCVLRLWRKARTGDDGAFSLADAD
jgi:SAM-dependent methyltransferase